MNVVPFKTRTAPPRAVEFVICGPAATATGAATRYDCTDVSTGGFAYGRGSLSTALTRISGAGCVGGANNCQQGSVADTLIGWTVGGGLEWAFANSWTVRAEYLYFDLGSLSHLMTDPFSR